MGLARSVGRSERDECMSEEAEKETFCVYAKVRAIDKPLLMLGLSFGRVVDDVLVPIERNERIYLDGVPSKKEDVLQLKILKETINFKQAYSGFHQDLHHASDVKRRELVAKNYDLMLEDLMRRNCEDITSQVVKAFDNSIKPKLSDYLPKKEELIKGAFEALLTSLKGLG